MSAITRAVLIGSSAIAIAALSLGVGAGAGPSSPLAAYPGFGHDPERDEARFEREERDREDLIARCMRNSGFKYFPAPSTLVTGGDKGPPSADDRNDRYVASLPPAQRNAYFVTLTGNADPFDEAAPAATSGSCVGSAFERSRGVFAARAELVEEIEEMEQAIATDPRVEKATQRWSSCMHGRGFDVSEPKAVEAAVDHETAQMLSTRSYDRSRLEEIERKQRKARDASRSCDTDRQEVLREVRIEFEGAFVDEYRQVLDSYR